MKDSSKMLTGYIIGGLLVLGIIPFIIYLITAFADTIYKIEVVQNDLLRWGLIVLLLAGGLSFGISSIVYLNVKGEGGPLEVANIEINPKTKKLVTSGPYRFTRNPMLLGTFLMYFAFAIFTNSLTAVFLVIVFAAFMLLVVVRKEEARLLKDFGSSFEQYRKRTPKIIPWVPK
ncbi:MAG: isoprenylcysteine carboxylmethyltransferase family protein [Lewinellaceae bacterium]|nr:isoprenylcysteine carboxylmethyltransferase family protein [Lewinellaceae bacterium]